MKLTLENKGQIQVIFGPMFSGKTTELIRRMKRYQIAKHQCLVIKYAKDVRYNKDSIATHDNQLLLAISATELNQLKNDALNYDVIGIDEGQFFPDVVQFAEDMANNGKLVIVAALDGTYQRKGFGSILELVPIAESIVKLRAICNSCYRDAAYTKRTTSETDVEVIGGIDKYIAVCRECYFNKTPDKNAIRSPLKENSNNEQKVTKELNVKKRINLTDGTDENMIPI